MSKKIRTEAVDYLFDAILSLKDKEECYTFFEDICTINELLSSGKDVKRAEDISGDCREDRRIHSNDQSCEPVIELWK